jgi:hypothetical protein
MRSMLERVLVRLARRAAWHRPVTLPKLLHLHTRCGGVQGDDKPLKLAFGITIIGTGGADEALWKLGQRFEAALETQAFSEVYGWTDVQRSAAESLGCTSSDPSPQAFCKGIGMVSTANVSCSTDAAELHARLW